MKGVWLQRHYSPWETETGMKSRLDRTGTGLLDGAGDESRLDRFKCPRWSAFWTVLKWYVKQWKSQLRRVDLVTVVFNCLSPRFPLLRRSMKIKTTRLLWRECGTNQCQGKQAPERSLPCRRRMDRIWMMVYFLSIFWSFSCFMFHVPSVFVHQVWLRMSNR